MIIFYLSLIGIGMGFFILLYRYIKNKIQKYYSMIVSEIRKSAEFKEIHKLTEDYEKKLKRPIKNGILHNCKNLDEFNSVDLEQVLKDYFMKNKCLEQLIEDDLYNESIIAEYQGKIDDYIENVCFHNKKRTNLRYKKMLKSMVSSVKLIYVPETIAVTKNYTSYPGRKYHSLFKRYTLFEAKVLMKKDFLKENA
jgi:hypothetical protein